MARQSVASSFEKRLSRAAIIAALSYGFLGGVYILFSDALLKSMVSDPDALTWLQTAKGWAFIAFTAVLLYWLLRRRAVRSVAAAEAIERSERRYRQMIETTSDGVWVVDEQGRTTYVNQTLAEMLGYEADEMLGRRMQKFVTPECRDLIERKWAERVKGRRELYDCELKRRDGSSMWAVIASSPIADEQGRFAGALKLITDITERKRTEQALERSAAALRTLLSELDHRVRNNLSSMVALVSLTRSGSASMEQFADTISKRIQTMAHAHTLASIAARSGLTLERLITEQLLAERRNQVALRGPTVEVAPSQAIAIALVVHELAELSASRGALSQPNGTIQVHWELEDERDGGAQVRLWWRERGGAQAADDSFDDATSQFVHGLVRADLRGELRRGFRGDGVEYEMTMRLQPPRLSPRDRRLVNSNSNSNAD